MCFQNNYSSCQIFRFHLLLHCIASLTETAVKSALKSSRYQDLFIWCKSIPVPIMAVDELAQTDSSHCELFVGLDGF